MTTTLALHCPKCAGEMATYERSRITVEQCRACRGIFLDRGELERLVEAEGGTWVGPLPGVPAGAAQAAPLPVPPARHPARIGPRIPGAPRLADQDRGYRSEWSIDIDPCDRPSASSSFRQ